MGNGDDVHGEHKEREQDPDRTTSNNMSNTIDSEFSSTTKKNLDLSVDDNQNDDVHGENKEREQDADRRNSNDMSNTIDSSTTKRDLNKNDEEKNDNPITHDKVYKHIKSKIDEGDKLRYENEALKKENSSLKKTIKSYEKGYNELELRNQHYENYLRKYELRILELDKKLNDSNKELESNKNRTEHFKTELRIHQKELDTKNMDINELKKINATLREEASKYQSALGVAANFRISDDKNHSVQLKKDIISLQDDIESYVTNLKGNIEVNVENVEKLAQKYGCLTNIIVEKTKRQNKSLIKAVLQRYVLEFIIEYANKYFEYFEDSGNKLYLESEILIRTNDLCFKLNEFSRTRTGTDKITSTSSIKIRQEAYAALSNRGFSDIIENNQMNEHNFIYHVRHILNESMNEYRTINDAARKQSIENMATDIIREIIRLFWFRLNVQEPIITIAWFDPHTKIDRDTMTGRWEEDDDIDYSIVDLCYFPIIGLNLDDPSKRKLYTRAKVFPRCQERNYAVSLFEKGCNMVKNVISSDKSESSTQQVGYDSNQASNHMDNYQNRK